MNLQVAILDPQPVAARAAVDNQFVAARFAVDKLGAANNEDRPVGPKKATR
jgi:hypothetical protein